MKYLADTDIIVDHIRGRNPIKKEVAEKGLGISIITFGELLYRAEKSANREKSLKIISSLLLDLSIRIISLTEEVMTEYAKLKASLETKGLKLHEFDLLIAACAKQNNLFLLTRNIKHFARINNLKFVN